MNKTIYALATSPARSAVAILRLSGPRVLDALRTMGVKRVLPPRVATLAKLYNPSSGELLDQGLILYFPAPHSYTGEEMAELHIHGSRAVMEELLHCLGALPDFRPADQGEFTRRAFLNGKLDLTEAEAVNDLIEAQTHAQKTQALRQMEGEFKQFYESLRARIIHCQALIEAYIDFPEENIPESVLSNLVQEVSSLKEDIASLLADKKRGERLREGIYCAIIGPPNAGKSSLLNYLAGRDAAIVSERAGTTRDVIEVRIDIGGFPVTLADTAGIRESLDPIEIEGIRRSIALGKQADIMIAIFDVATWPNLDSKTLSLCNSNSLILINKCDFGTPSVPTHIHDRPLFPVSLRKEAGLGEVIRGLESIVIQEFANAPTPFITRSRHRSHLEAAARHLTRLDGDLPIELLGEELRLSADEIGKITGKILPDNILGEIFAQFCIGK